MPARPKLGRGSLAMQCGQTFCDTLQSKSREPFVNPRVLDAKLVAVEPAQMQ